MATIKKSVKKACSGTSLYPKSSSVSSKLKAGGKIKKAQKGSALTKVNDSIKPPKPKYDGYRPPYVPSKNQSKFDEGIENVKKLYQDKVNQQKFGGAVKAKDGKWIQKAVNPAHKGYCTPMTKATCTPKRKALAKTFKKMARERKGK